MEDFIFVGSKQASLLQQMFVVNKLKKLNKNYFHYGFRQTNDDKFFYLYGTRTKVVCATPTSIFDCYGFGEIELGHCEYKYNKSTKNLHISFIKVNEPYRGQGIGDQMLEYVKKVAVKLGAKSMTLDRLCVYTNGEKCVTYYGDDQTLEELTTLRASGKPVVDKNLKFYTKHGFLKDGARRPMHPHLVPMVLPQIKPANPKQAQVGKVYRFQVKNQ